MAPSLQEYHEKVKDATSLQSLKNRLLKYQERLVVVEEQDLRTWLIAEVYTQVSTAYPRKNKTRKIISDRYYQPRIVTDINWYVRNYNGCRRSIIPRDKTLGLLKPLPILERPQQYIFIDFYKLPLDRNGYNIVIILVNRFSKRCEGSVNRIYWQSVNQNSKTRTEEGRGKDTSIYMGQVSKREPLTRVCNSAVTSVRS